MFLLCLTDESKNHYSLQVIGQASEKGVHFAEHVRPILDTSTKGYDYAIKDIFIPLEGAFNRVVQKLYVTHADEQVRCV